MPTAMSMISVAVVGATLCRSVAYGYVIHREAVGQIGVCERWLIATAEFGSGQKKAESTSLPMVRMSL